MSNYKVLNQPVEINGKTYPVDAIVTTEEFKPRPADAPEDEKSELDSLLDTGHIMKMV
jgi:hypothetical protein